MDIKYFEEILLNYNIADIPKNIRDKMDAFKDENIEAAELWETAQFMEKAMQQLPEPVIDDDSLESLHQRIMAAVRSEAQETVNHKPSRIFFIPREILIPLSTAAAALVIGLAAGRMFLIPEAVPVTNYTMVQTSLSDILQDNTINDMRIEVTNQSTGDLAIEFTRIREERIEGNISDPDIQKLLAYAMVKEENPGTRLRSVKLVQDNVSAAGNDLQSALITSVKSDENQGVRMKALRALSELPLTEEIRQTCIDVISHDDSPSMRMEAIQIITRDRDQNEETKDALRKAADVDQSEGVQSLIKEYYNNLQGSPLKK